MSSMAERHDSAAVSVSAGLSHCSAANAGVGTALSDRRPCSAKAGALADATLDAGRLPTIPAGRLAHILHLAPAPLGGLLKALLALHSQATLFSPKPPKQPVLSWPQPAHAVQL